MPARRAADAGSLRHPSSNAPVAPRNETDLQAFIRLASIVWGPAPSARTSALGTPAQSVTVAQTR